MYLFVVVNFRIGIECNWWIGFWWIAQHIRIETLRFSAVGDPAACARPQRWRTVWRWSVNGGNMCIFHNTIVQTISGKFLGFSFTAQTGFFTFTSRKLLASSHFDLKDLVATGIKVKGPAEFFSASQNYYPLLEILITQFIVTCVSTFCLNTRLICRLQPLSWN